MTIRKLLIIFILSSSLFLFFGWFNLGMAFWKGELIDGTVHVIGKTSIAVDSNGNPHIGYLFRINENEMGVKYAFHDGVNWTKTQIDTIGSEGSGGKTISITIDKNDYPHFAYVDSGNVYYTYFSGDTWVYYYIRQEQINIGGRDNLCSEIEPAVSSRSIAIDKGASDRVHITYLGCRPDFLQVKGLRTLFHVVFNGSEFDSYIRDQERLGITQLGDTRIYEPGVLILKDDDSAGIVYLKTEFSPFLPRHESNQLNFSHIKDGEHHIKTLKEDYHIIGPALFGDNFSAVLGDDNALSISYEFGAILKYMRIYGLDGDTQNYEESNVKGGLFGSDYSISLDNSGEPNIAFTNTIDYPPNSYLGYAWRYNNAWLTELPPPPPLGSGSFGSGVSIAIDDSNHKHVSHIDSDADSLYYSFTCADVDEDDVCDNYNDNCPGTENPDQLDCNGDGIGDACESDIDSDGIPDNCDNCRYVYNSYQLDTDSDGVGDMCDNCRTQENGPIAGTCTVENPDFGLSGADACDRKVDTPEEIPCSVEWHGCYATCLFDKKCEQECDDDLNRCLDNINCPPQDGLVYFCSMAQEDTDGDGHGNVCETAFEERTYETEEDLMQGEIQEIPLSQEVIDNLCLADTFCPSIIISLMWPGSELELSVDGKNFYRTGDCSNDCRFDLPILNLRDVSKIFVRPFSIPEEGETFTIFIQPDSDNDGIGDSEDSFPYDPTDDLDGDGIGTEIDNCPDEANPAQIDSDDDGVGNVCDNCPKVYNPNQDDCEPIEISMVVCPDDCDNIINLKAKGKLPVVLLGNSNFDITQVDTESLKLDGVSPLRVKIADVGKPGVCGEQSDGHLDLMLKFSRPEILNTIGGNNHARKLFLSLTGSLKKEFGGDPISASELIILPK